MEINHANIFYVRNIHPIGGVETFVYELAKKYKDYDIAIVCKTIAPKQRERLQKYCRVYVHDNQRIQCKVLITNWDTSIVDYVDNFVENKTKIYTVLHTDYSNKTEIKGLPKDRPEITYIGITEDSKKKFEEITGIDRTILCRNPLEIEEEEPMLTLVSATRLTEIKDNGRHLKLAKALEAQGIKFIWYIFTTDEYKNNPIWTDENIVHMKNRLDLGPFMKNADWYVQLSSCEGDSYSLKEALYRGTPVVVCELPYFKEIGIKDGENALFYNINNSNAMEIAEKMRKPFKFTFSHVEDGYNEILDKTKSYYEEEKKMRDRVRCIKAYNDIQLGKKITPNDDPFIVDRLRADQLVAAGVCKVVEEDVDKLIETVKTENTEESVRKTRTTKRPIAKRKKI